MKYKQGDRVRIKSLEWYNKNKDIAGDIRYKSGPRFSSNMKKYCGQTMTIRYVYSDAYRMEEDCPAYESEYFWTDEMIEGLVEDETALNKWTGLKVELELSKSVIGVSNVESLRGERFMSGFVKAIIPPEGYQFVDENGNVINATKIVLEKKKKEYPKTYNECCEILDVSTCLGFKGMTDGEVDLYGKFISLIRCRDAYWKIAGEGMGLEKPWELSIGTPIYYIYYNRTVGTIKNDYADDIQGNIILAFPTEEMRDAFKENFDPDIEICKELL